MKESTTTLEQELPGFAKPQQQKPEVEQVSTTTEDDSIVVENLVVKKGDDEKEQQAEEQVQVEKEPAGEDSTTSSGSYDEEYGTSEEKNDSYDDSKSTSHVEQYENTEKYTAIEQDVENNFQEGQEHDTVETTSSSHQHDSTDYDQYSSEAATARPTEESYEYDSGSHGGEEIDEPLKLHSVHPVNQVELVEKHNHISDENHSNLIEGEDETTPKSDSNQESYEAINDSSEGELTTEFNDINRREDVVTAQAVEDEESSADDDTQETTDRLEKENEIEDEPVEHTTPTMVRLASRTTLMEPEAPVSTTVATLIAESETEALTTERLTTTTSSTTSSSTTTTTSTTTASPVSSTDGSIRVKHQGNAKLNR